MKNLIKVKLFIFPIIGIICIIWTEHVVRVLPYLLGSAMVIDGLLIGISCFQDKHFLNHDSEELVHGIVMFIMGLELVATSIRFKGRGEKHESKIESKNS